MVVRLAKLEFVPRLFEYSVHGIMLLGGAMSGNGSSPRLDRIEKILEDHARAIQQSREWHDREIREIRELGRKTRDDLRRWAALGVKEARNQRKRQREIDQNITRLSAAQLVTEERLASLISSLGRGGNGGRRNG